MPNRHVTAGAVVRRPRSYRADHEMVSSSRKILNIARTTDVFITLKIHMIIVFAVRDAAIK
jgi:hypothetical protein